MPPGIIRTYIGVRGGEGAVFDGTPSTPPAVYTKCVLLLLLHAYSKYVYFFSIRAAAVVYDTITILYTIT